MKYTTIRFDSKSERLYRGYFPVIPNQNSHKECFEIGQWDTPIDDHNQKYKDDMMLKFIEDPGIELNIYLNQRLFILNSN